MIHSNDLHDGYNTIAIHRTGPDAELHYEVVHSTLFGPSTAETMAEAVLTDITCVASAVIQREGACQRGIAAWAKPHYVTRSDWNLPAAAVFTGPAIELPPVLESALSRLIVMPSLVRGI